MKTKEVRSKYGLSRKINFIKENKLLDKKEDHFKEYSSSKYELLDQAKKSVGRMPWHQEPKKDAAISEMPRGGESSHRSVDIRMGKPGRLKTCH